MKNSLFASGLIVIIGLLMLLAALQLFGWGKGTSSLDPEGFDASSLQQLDAQSEGANETPSKELVTQITALPLFNLDRKPYEGLLDGGEIEEPKIEVEAQPLKAKVTSIIMIGDDKYAMMVDQVTNEKITLEQGMPLPGEQGLWVVDQINARDVTFVSEGEEPVSLELEVFSGALKGKSRPKSNKNKPARANAEIKKVDQSAPKKNSAEEIRKKIAERRAQMRANAAKGKKNDK